MKITELLGELYAKILGKEILEVTFNEERIVIWIDNTEFRTILFTKDLYKQYEEIFKEY